jgi:hypothetical protein
MGRAIKSGFLLVVISTTIWVLLLLAFIFAPKYGIKFYPRFTVPIAVLSPLFFSPLMARVILKIKKEKLNFKELMIFSSIVIFGCAIFSFIIEAAILHRAISQIQEITFLEVISAPLNKRYNMTVLFGMSFFVSTIVVAVFTAFVRVPATINLHLRLTKADTK